MRILVINPNTTVSMTETIAAAARAVVSVGNEIVTTTSAMGPASIEGYYDEALAVPGLLQAIRDGERNGVDAAVVACFDDTGLDAARAMASIPVVGICEAALITASMLAQRFTIVTTLERSRVPIESLVIRYGFGSRVEVRACDIPVLALDNSGSIAPPRLCEEIEAALRGRFGEAIILGCAGMADLATWLREEFGVPVIDGVGAAVKQAEALVGLGLSTSKSGTYAPPPAKSYLGVLADFRVI